MPAPAGIHVTGPVRERFDEVLTPEALDFLGTLHREFDARRRELLAARQRRSQELADGGIATRDLVQRLVDEELDAIRRARGENTFDRRLEEPPAADGTHRRTGVGDAARRPRRRPRPHRRGPRRVPPGNAYPWSPETGVPTHQGG